MVCTLKVENVVKPPSSPVIVAWRTVGVQVAGPATDDSATQTPITSEPATFADRVPQGNPPPANRDTDSVTACRRTPPAALPAAIATHVVHAVPSMMATA